MKSFAFRYYRWSLHCMYHEISEAEEAAVVAEWRAALEHVQPGCAALDDAMRDQVLFCVCGGALLWAGSARLLSVWFRARG